MIARRMFLQVVAAMVAAPAAATKRLLVMKSRSQLGPMTVLSEATPSPIMQEMGMLLRTVYGPSIVDQQNAAAELWRNFHGDEVVFDTRGDVPDSVDGSWGGYNDNDHDEEGDGDE